jgi:hypothetical protein
MHGWPMVHSADETQSCADPIVASAVEGWQDWPEATDWHAVFAEVVVATPQHTIPDPEQSIAPRHEKPAVRSGHELPCATHVPPPL